jgi:hypothetical protein
MYDDRGCLRFPDEEGWDAWVSPSRLRNFCSADPLVDWLELFGRDHGYLPDAGLPGYDPQLDFGQFVMDRGQRFERAVVAHLRTLAQVVTIPRDQEGTRSLAAAMATVDAMAAGTEIIDQGVLRDPQHRTYGGVDLLVRSDLFARLFPGAVSADETPVAAPAFGHGYHYRVVDIKFKNLALNGRGEAMHSAHLPGMAQVYLYNRALGRIQGFEPPAGYLLGRGWSQTVCGVTGRGTSCMDRLAAVPMSSASRTDTLSNTVAKATDWVRRLRREGAGWSIEPAPAAPELWPNARHTNHGWTSAVKQIATRLDDLSLVWQARRDQFGPARDAGITSWRDSRCTPERLGVCGPGTHAALSRLLRVNRDGGAAIEPVVIRAEVEQWATPGAVEFFVDFETVSGIDDDFRAIPEQGGQPLIFMIGCGHHERGEWRFAQFTADALSEDAEGTIIEAWLAHMATVTRLFAPGTTPLVFHWSAAETAALSTAFTSARARHGRRALRWAEPNWFDFLGRVMRAPGDVVAVRGAMGFGLKAVAKAMRAHGLIETAWPDGIVDGLGAMVAAWRAAAACADSGEPLRAHPLMAAVAAYNEVDCKVMSEVVSALRGRTPRTVAVAG